MVFAIQLRNLGDAQARKVSDTSDKYWRVHVVLETCSSAFWVKGSGQVTVGRTVEECCLDHHILG